MMASRWIPTLAFAGVSALLFAASARGQEKAPDYVGSNLYKTYCASCHGPNAKGDGPLAEHLRVHPPDLTLIAKRMGGTFQGDRVHKIIDGRTPVKGHGGPDMPVWGDAFKSSREGYSDESVKARIQALVEYLEEIQEKPAK